MRLWDNDAISSLNAMSSTHQRFGLGSEMGAVARDDHHSAVENTGFAARALSCRAEVATERSDNGGQGLACFCEQDTKSHNKLQCS